MVNGAIIQMANGQVTLPASSTAFVELTAAGSVQAVAGKFTPGCIPLYSVTTSGNSVTAYDDMRAFQMQRKHVAKITLAGASAYELTASECLADGLVFAGTPSADIEVVIPAVPAVYNIRNTSTKALKFRHASGASTEIPTSAGAILSTDGAAIAVVATSAAVSGTAISKFLDLTDTPSSYTGAAGKLLAVNAAGTAIEFIDAGARPIIETAVAITLSAANMNSVIVCTAACTITCPSDTAIPLGAGWTVIQAGAGAVTFAAGSGITIYKKTSSTGATNEDGAVVQISKLMATYFSIAGDYV